jgi:hypothetical protein
MERSRTDHSVTAAGDDAAAPSDVVCHAIPSQQRVPLGTSKALQRRTNHPRRSFFTRETRLIKHPISSSLPNFHVADG